MFIEVRKCSKRGYADERAARIGLMECRAKGRCENRHYYCHECRVWHLTSQPLRKAA